MDGTHRGIVRTVPMRNLRSKGVFESEKAGKRSSIISKRTQEETNINPAEKRGQHIVLGGSTVS